ncbi:MAG TPA: hypothetical protein VN441_10875 [Syntrophomonas sp.]|nr:hypothetical protein [Syntrophomonas sp.]
MKKYRVIIWGLGNVGKVALRMCRDKKSLELVGVIDTAPDKVGKDAGEVFGYDKTGVIISDNADEVLQIDADVVLCYLPLVRDAELKFKPSGDDIIRALNAKKNVITTLPISYQWATDPELAEKLDQSAKANGVTYAPMGFLPGHYGSYLPMVLGGLMERIDKITIASGEDDQYNNSQWVHVFGYGVKPEEFTGPNFPYGGAKTLKRVIQTYYQDGVYEIGARLGFRFTEVTSTHDIFTTPIPLKTVLKDVPAGTICGHRFKIMGMVGDQPAVTLDYVHRICTDQVEEPKYRDVVRLEGSPAVIEVEYEGLITLEQSYETSTAPSVNAVPNVVEAEPGYKNGLDLRVVVPIR